MKIFRSILRSRAAYAGIAVGVTIFATVIAWQGVDDVVDAFSRAGWSIVAITLLHLPPLWADAMGWRRLILSEKRPPRRTMLWGRWIGESINDLLPVFQMGGNVVKAWILLGRGVRVGLAGASVVVDVTLVVLSQILFTVLGLCLIVPSLSRGEPLLVVIAGVGILSVLLSGFYFVQRHGFFSIIVRISKRFAGGPQWTSVSHGAATIDAEVLRLYADHRALTSSGCWHFLSWFLGIGEVWLALRLLGHPVDVGTALLFESLGQAIRTGAFAVPGALGIQEGGYVLVGSVLGIEPGVALALSLARRVRELLLGLPGLLAWQISSIHRSMRTESTDSAIPPSAPEGTL